MIKIGIDLAIDKSIKFGKSDLINIDCIDQSVEIDDTLVSFINHWNSVQEMTIDFMQRVRFLANELKISQVFTF